MKEIAKNRKEIEENLGKYQYCLERLILTQYSNPSFCLLVLLTNILPFKKAKSPKL